MGRSYLDYPTAAVGAASPVAGTTQAMAGFVDPEVKTRMDALDFTPVVGATAPAAVSTRFGATADPDGDGLDNAAEVLAGTDPYDADTDNDGEPDATDADPLDDQVQ